MKKNCINLKKYINFKSSFQFNVWPGHVCRFAYNEKITLSASVCVHMVNSNMNADIIFHSFTVSRGDKHIEI